MQYEKMVVLCGAFVPAAGGMHSADPAVPGEPLTEPDKEPLIGQAKELVIAENGATRTTPMPHIPLRVWMRTEPICIP